MARAREEGDRTDANDSGTSRAAGKDPGLPNNHQPCFETGEGVLSSNAMADKRFSKGKSVHNLGIRSALCVPIKARKLSDKGGDEVIGVIYIDSSVKNYTYSPDQLRLLTAIGLQAGLAVQNAKLFQAGLEAERLAAVGETTAALSHSIKNILQALRGGADVVEMGLERHEHHAGRKGLADRRSQPRQDLPPDAEPARL